MSLINLPQPLDNLLNRNNSFSTASETSQLLDRLIVVMVELLGCDRCHLYIRDPELLIGQTLHCHRVHPEIPDAKDIKPYSEPSYLAEQDPLFAAAVECEQSIFIDELESVSSKESDLAFFRQHYQGQTALIQAHICSNNQLWGIFQAAQFNRPRPWTQFDRSLVATVIDRITPLVSIYVRRKLRHTIQEINDPQK